MTFTRVIWIAAIFGTLISYYKDKKKTKIALKKTKNMFIKMLPMMGVIIIVIGLTFALIPEETIQNALGGYTIRAVLLSGFIGSITLIPMFIATPLAGSLLEQGAGILAISMFMTTLNMVGLITAPMEKEFFGWKLTFWENFLGFIAAIIIAIIMGLILS